MVISNYAYVEKENFNMIVYNPEVLNLPKHLSKVFLQFFFVFFFSSSCNVIRSLWIFPKEVFYFLSLFFMFWRNLLVPQMFLFPDIFFLRKAKVAVLWLTFPVNTNFPKRSHFSSIMILNLQLYFQLYKLLHIWSMEMIFLMQTSLTLF